MDDLTLPGSIPGLLRRGSPVTQGARSGVVVHLWEADMASVAWAPPHDAASDCCWAVDRLALDLTDATGRTHATWWWRRVRHDDVPAEHWIRVAPEMGGSYGAAGLAGYEEFALPLDLTDPRRLPDGSRWVDAEALRRVVLHVAGVTRG